MKTSILANLFFILSLISLNAQVGINTTDPQSQLDIRSSNQATPSNMDGILIPKVDNFPATNPTATQDGMLIFVTGSGTPTKGFYYWDQATTSWTNLGGISNDADWFSESTTTAPTSINDDIYTLGHVAIGRNTANYPLHINADETVQQTIRVDYTGADNGAKIGLYYNNQNSGSGAHHGIYSRLIGSGTGTKVGIYNQISGTSSQSYYNVQNYSQGSGFGTRYGTFQQISGTGNGDHYGNYNNLIANGSGDKYGTYNTATSGSGDKYGSYNMISQVYDGTHYGVYSNATKSGSFAGYFLGNVSIGTTNTNNYILPASRGTDGQVMQTDGAGNITWQDIATSGAERINDLIDGKSDNDGTDDGSSIFLGIGAGVNDNEANNRNVGIGFEVLHNNVNGYGNNAIGYQSLFSNISGYDNISIGESSLLANTDGFQNNAIGVNSLITNISGSRNVANGYGAMNFNTNGSNNTAIGTFAMYNNILGSNNVAVGFQSLGNNTDGTNNVAIGDNALFSNVTGNSNVVIGIGAGYNETGSNKLYIENSSSTAPLIYGEFDNDLLRVNGTLDINNAYRFPVSDGTTNQVLQTDGVGNITWETPSGLGEFKRIGTIIQNTTNTTIDSFVFGSSQLNNITSTTDDDTRLFFNKLKGAFRAGRVVFGGVDFWNDNFVGLGSFAVGTNTIASGYNSSAIGHHTYARSYAETTIGFFSSDYVPNSTGIVDSNDRLFVIGNGTASNRSNAITVLKNGNLGMGSIENPLEQIHIDDKIRLTDGYIHGTAGEEVILGTATDDTRVGLFVNGTEWGPFTNNTVSLGSTGYRWSEVWSVNPLNTTSDKRLKKDITPLNYGLEAILSLNPISYKWKQGKQDTKLGFVAQEVEIVIPEIVKLEKGNLKRNSLSMRKDGQEDYYAMSYSELIPILTKAIQEQQILINDLKTTIKQQDQKSQAQEKTLETLLNRINALEKAIN
ncbi:tail fiber domain-containing protein [Psychroserpens sp. MEBiC05023]